MLKARVSRVALLPLLLIALIAMVPIVWALWVAHAASRTWTGGTPGDPSCIVNDLWNNPCNWSGKNLPAAGDDLTFPSSMQQSSVNKFPNLTTFNSLSISGGHSMSGNGVSLNSGITTTSGTIALSSIKLNNNQTFNATAAGTVPTIVSPIDNNGKTLTLDGAGNFTLTGVISGAGGLTKNGTGTTQLAGPNTYSSTTSINQGTLLVFGSQKDSFVSIASGGTLAGTGTVGPINVNSDSSPEVGKISPGPLNNGTGILTVEGNVSFLGTGVKGFDVDLKSTTVGSGYDQLKVKGTVNLGTNTSLSVSLGFTPSAGSTFLIIDNDGTTDVVIGSFFGHPEASMFTANGITFFITYRGGDGNDVVLTAISGILSFTASSYTGHEGEGAANITLSRSGGGNTTAVAKVTLADVTTSPSDYRFTPGALDTTFDPGSGTTGSDFRVFTLALQADGKIVIGGGFEGYNGTPRNRIARINADGSVDTTFDPGLGPNQQVDTMTVQADGKIIIGGFFTSYSGTPRKNIARLNANGSLDTTFDPGSGTNGNTVSTTALQPDGKIIIAGDFTQYNATPRIKIARLNANGSVDTTFDPGSGAGGGLVKAIALQADGKIVIGGNFSGYDGIPRNNIARLNANGSLDTTFDPGSGANSSVETTAVQSDGKIVIGGFFTSYNNTPRDHIARLNANGSLDTTFDPGSGTSGTGGTGSVLTTALQADGKIIIGGDFLQYNGAPRLKIARLNANGTLDNSFNPGSGFAGSGSIITVQTTALTLQPDGKIVVIGNFISYDGISRIRIARINGDLFATWGPNDFADKTIILPLVNDGLVEGNETLGLTLVPLAGAVAGTPSSATLTISDSSTRRWDGSSVDSNWQTKENWENDVAPVPGDDLIFPAGAARLSNDNDFPAGTTFNSISFSGAPYTLSGNAITLINGISDSVLSPANTIQLASIKLHANQTFTKGGTSLVVPSDIDTNGKTLTLDGAGQKPLRGIISGTGGLVINGTGLVTTAISGTNSFSGPTVINSGSFFLSCNQPNSAVQLNSGELLGGFIPGTLKSLTASGGLLHIFERGQLIVNENVLLSSNVTFQAGLITSIGKLNVGGTLNLGNSILDVVAQFGTPPAPGQTFTIINKTSAGAIQGTFNNLPEGAGLMIGGVPFTISYVGGDGNDGTLTVTSTRRWDGDSAVNGNWQTKENWEGDVAPLPGDDLVFPSGAARLTNSNDFPAGTTFNSITISAPGYLISGNSIALNAGVTSSALGTVPSIRVPIKLNADQTFNASINGAGLAFDNPARIDNNGHQLTLTGPGTITINSTDITGSGGLTKSGSGSASIGNFSALPNFAYTGTTTIAGGTLTINSKQPNSPISLTGGNLINGSGFSPANTTIVGPITATGGTISPGGSGGTVSSSALNVSGNVVLSSATSYFVNLNGTSVGTQYDQLNVSGTVNLSSATLNVAVGSSFTPAAGDTFVIVNNDLADSIVGTFAGLPEGSILAANGFQFKISYVGSDDNDVVLTAVAGAFSSVQFSASSYFVNEGAGFATITLTRTGDTSGSASVDFETSDLSAEQRTDYTIGAGTVTFAPGETSKTFSVLIVDDLYVEGDKVLNLTLSNPTGGAALASPNVVTLKIVDNDSSSPTTNPLDTASFFVRQHYFDFLSRFPDIGGSNFWTGVITQCGSDPVCIQSKRIDVSNAFFYELEFQQTGAYTFRLYRAAFGNNQPFPNPDGSNQTEAKKLPGYAVFARDRARVVGGADLPTGQQSLANAFVLRNEFLLKYPASQDGPTFVDAVLATIRNELGVDLTSQRNALITLFNSGGRGAVLYRLADDNLQTNPINNRAFIDEEYNRAFVATQYFGYLRRDADIGGFLFWLGQVNSGPLRDVAKQHAMVCSFITSAEYQQRFSPIVTHSNAECGP